MATVGGGRAGGGKENVPAGCDKTEITVTKMEEEPRDGQSDG